MDAITLLKNDHQAVEKLFKRFEKAGDHAYVERRKIVDQIIEELSIHASIEETLFYPVTRATVPTVEDIALESLEEHHIVKWLLSELEGMDPAAERFVPKVTVLMENVRHHVEEEESDYFPKVRDALGRNALTDLGDAMVEAKASAPSHPHPKAPDTPPGNVVAGHAAVVVEKVADTVSGLAQGGVSVAQDVIARITGNEAKRTSPTGSPTTRRVAKKVHTEVTQAADRAERTGKATVTSARNGAKKTAGTARTGAKRTSTTAKTAARRTSATAKKAATTTKAKAKAASK